MTTGSTFQEPTGDQPAGHLSYRQARSPYERYMEAEGIPVFRGIGVSDLRELLRLDLGQ